MKTHFRSQFGHIFVRFFHSKIKIVFLQAFLHFYRGFKFSISFWFEIHQQRTSNSKWQHKMYLVCTERCNCIRIGSETGRRSLSCGNFVSLVFLWHKTRTPCGSRQQLFHFTRAKIFAFTIDGAASNAFVNSKMLWNQLLTEPPSRTRDDAIWASWVTSNVGFEWVCVWSWLIQHGTDNNENRLNWLHWDKWLKIINASNTNNWMKEKRNKKEFNVECAHMIKSSPTKFELRKLALTFNASRNDHICLRPFIFLTFHSNSSFISFHQNRQILLTRSVDYLQLIAFNAWFFNGRKNWTWIVERTIKVKVFLYLQWKCFHGGATEHMLRLSLIYLSRLDEKSLKSFLTTM